MFVHEYLKLRNKIADKKNMLSKREASILRVPKMVRDWSVEDETKEIRPAQLKKLTNYNKCQIHNKAYLDSQKNTNLEY